jgi:hypothetical protein
MDPPKSFIKRIITNLIWEPIFSTQDLEQYIKAKGILLDKGIPIKTKTPIVPGDLPTLKEAGI